MGNYMRYFLYVIFKVKKKFIFRPVLIFGLRSRVAIIMVDFWGLDYGEDSQEFDNSQRTVKIHGHWRMGV